MSEKDGVEIRDIKKLNEALEGILHGFIWNSTPQGSDYWNEVYDNLISIWDRAIDMVEAKGLTITEALDDPSLFHGEQIQKSQIKKKPDYLSITRDLCRE